MEKKITQAARLLPPPFSISAQIQRLVWRRKAHPALNYYSGKYF